MRSSLQGDQMTDNGLARYPDDRAATVLRTAAVTGGNAGLAQRLPTGVRANAFDPGLDARHWLGV